MSVDAGWPMALPLVAGFLEMFAGVMYNREEEKTKDKFTTPPCIIWSSQLKYSSILLNNFMKYETIKLMSIVQTHISFPIS